MPADLLRYTGGARPDAEGMVGYNRGGFKSPEFQCGAMRSMLRAVVREDRQGIDDGWRAIDATFRQQSDNGGFGRQGAPHGGPSAAAFWLAEMDQAILVLRESALGSKYKRANRRASAQDRQGRPLARQAASPRAAEVR